MILHHLREAETLATALDDPRRLGWVSAYMADYFNSSNTYDQDRAVECGQRALASPRPAGTSLLR